MNIPKSDLMTTVNNIRIETTTGTPVTEIDNLLIENITLGGVDIPSASFYGQVQLSAGVTANDFKFKGLRNKNNVTPFIPLDLPTGTIKKLLISDVTADNAKFGVAYISNVDIDNIEIEKNLGTKSVNQLYYRNNGVPNIKKSSGQGFW